MHSLLEGVIKSLLKFWFSQEAIQLQRDTDKRFSLRSEIGRIQERLSKIRPPRFVPAVPRLIENWNTWKAHEYLSFILYYALPVFDSIMEYDQLQHLVKLVVFIEIILAKEISVVKFLLLKILSSNLYQN
jgi:hypothetical protein